jgi:hypothetical protein
MTQLPELKVLRLNKKYNSLSIKELLGLSVNKKLKVLKISSKLYLEEIELLILNKTPMFHLTLEETEIECQDYREFIMNRKGIVL